MLRFAAPPLRRIERFFIEPLVPRAGFAVSRTSLSGVVLSPKNGRVQSHVTLSLAAGLVAPSFDRPNIPGVRELEDRLREAVRRLGSDGADILLLLPESCFKAYVIAFEEFPSAAKERDELLSHRLGKILPLRPADARVSYDVLPGDGKAKVFLSVARASIVDEYEGLFGRAGLRARTVSLPSLGLLRCVPSVPGQTALIVDVEEDSIGLLASSCGDVLLYRFKPFLQEAAAAAASGSVAAKLAQSVTEIQNTLHFLEDHEGRKADLIHLRCLLAPPGGDAAAYFRDRLPVPVKPVECPLAVAAGVEEKLLLAPLLGHLL